MSTGKKKQKNGFMSRTHTHSPVVAAVRRDAVERVVGSAILHSSKSRCVSSDSFRKGHFRKRPATYRGYKFQPRPRWQQHSVVLSKCAGYAILVTELAVYIRMVSQDNLEAAASIPGGHDFTFCPVKKGEEAVIFFNERPAL